MNVTWRPTTILPIFNKLKWIKKKHWNSSPNNEDHRLTIDKKSMIACFWVHANECWQNIGWWSMFPQNLCFVCSQRIKRQKELFECVMRFVDGNKFKWLFFPKLRTAISFCTTFAVVKHKMPKALEKIYIDKFQKGFQ